MIARLKRYGTAYYAFIAGVCVGLPAGTLVCAYTIRVLMERLS